MSPTYADWFADVTELAALLYDPAALRDLEAELIAGWEVGDSPAECLAGLFSDA